MLFRNNTIRITSYNVCYTKLLRFKKVIDIILYIFKALDFKEYITQVSLRDPNDHSKYIGSEENWDKAEQAIIEACDEKGMETIVETGEA